MADAEAPHRKPQSTGDGRSPEKQQEVVPERLWGRFGHRCNRWKSRRTIAAGKSCFGAPNVRARWGSSCVGSPSGWERAPSPR